MSIGTVLRAACQQKSTFQGIYRLALGLYGQPYFEGFLAERDVANPAAALLEREDTFFVSRDPSLVLEFLRERYSPYARVRQTGLADDVPVWEFYLDVQGGQA